MRGKTQQQEQEAGWSHFMGTGNGAYPRLYTSSAARLYLLSFLSFPKWRASVQRHELVRHISHSNLHKFPSLSDISLKPCCTVTMSFKLLLLVHPTMPYACALNQILIPALHGFPRMIILPGLLTSLLMSGQRASREELIFFSSWQKTMQAQQVQTSWS